MGHNHKLRCNGKQDAACPARLLSNCRSLMEERIIPSTPRYLMLKMEPLLEKASKETLENGERKDLASQAREGAEEFEKLVREQERASDISKKFVLPSLALAAMGFGISLLPQVGQHASNIWKALGSIGLMASAVSGMVYLTAEGQRGIFQDCLRIFEGALELAHPGEQNHRRH